MADYPILPADALQLFDRIAVDPTELNRIYVMGCRQLCRNLLISIPRRPAQPCIRARLTGPSDLTSGA